ncbi:MAG TPA: hypothetical protein VF593_12035 [Chthoniobacteraceae bacterium]|jgi:hypothetical protein
MGKENLLERVKAGTLAEIDSLVGRYLTGERPLTHWEDSHAQLRFESIEEALEALREPYFQQFIPEDDRASTVLREVQEFRRYSTDLVTSWEIVEKLSRERHCLRISHEGNAWQAAFGEMMYATANSAPLAICLAALRVRGIDVEFAGPGTEGQELPGMHQGSLDRVRPPGTLAD